MNFAIPCIKKFTKQNNVEEYLYIPYALAKYDNYTIQKTNRIEQLFKDTILPTFNKLNIKIKLLDIEQPIYIQQQIISNTKGSCKVPAEILFVVKLLTLAINHQSCESP